jgi:hypothetical protein
MAGALISTVSEVLKYRYLGPLQTQLNNEIAVEQILDLDTKRIDLDGLKAVVPMHYGRNSGVGARREDEDLPAAGAQAYKSAQYDLAYMYGRARFTGPAIQKTKTDAGAFIRVVTDELDRLRDDLRLDVARQYYGPNFSGVNGGIAKIASVAGAVLTLTSSEAIDKGFVHINMIVDIGTTTATSSGKASAVTITDVDAVAVTVTVSSAGTAAANDYLFRSGANDASGTKEIDAGLQNLIPTAANTIGGINAASAGFKWWDALRDTSGGAVSLDNLMVMWNRVLGAGVDAGDVVTLTTPGLARRLFATADFKSNVRFVDKTALKGGFESISFSSGGSSQTLVTDRLAPYGKVHFVPKSSIKVYSPGNWDFLSRDGLTVRWVDSRDAFQAVLYRYVNLGTNRRNNSAVMSGLTDTGF